MLVKKKVMDPLVVDGGFSAAKAIFGERRCRVKTVWRHDELNGDLFEGRKLVTGEAALASTGSCYLRDVDELISYYPLFVHACARQFGTTTAPALAVGLPYSYWYQEATRAVEGKENVLELLQEKLQSFKVGSYEYMFESVHVVPQGLGCIYSFLAQKPALESNLLLIDIGFNTVIVALYSQREERVLYGRTYYKAGIFDLVQNYLKPAVAKHLKDKSYSPAELNHLLETKRINHGLSMIDIAHEVDSCASSFTGSFLERIVGEIRQSHGALDFSHLVLSGGGARLFAELDFSHPDITTVILPDPEMSNAVGFDLFARGELSTRKRV